jgi:predicted nucleic acid-binding protein
VRITPAPLEKPKPFGERFAPFKGAVPRLVEDRAEQHDHYRLGGAEATTVVADTFVLIAWLNPRDNAHAVVAAYLDGFTGQLVTTEWVLVELVDALSAPEARAKVVAFVQAVRAAPLFDVVGYVPNVYQAGSHLFANRPDKAWSLTDCISFGVMSERGLSDALTADHDFEHAGFRAVFKQ